MLKGGRGNRNSGVANFFDLQKIISNAKWNAFRLYTGILIRFDVYIKLIQDGTMEESIGRTVISNYIPLQILSQSLTFCMNMHSN